MFLPEAYRQKAYSVSTPRPSHRPDPGLYVMTPSLRVQGQRLTQTSPRLPSTIRASQTPTLMGVEGHASAARFLSRHLSGILVVVPSLTELGAENRLEGRPHSQAYTHMVGSLIR